MATLTMSKNKPKIERVTEPAEILEAVKTAEATLKSISKKP